MEEYKFLLEYGVLGIIAAVFLRWVWWNTKKTDEVLREKDAYIERINERRAETGEAFAKTGEILIQQNKEMLAILRRYYEPSPDSSPDDGPSDREDT